MVFLATVYLEYKMGWIGSPKSQDPEFVPHFIKSNWGQLKGIWGWQAFANFLFTLAYFHLAKISRNDFWIPLGSLWAVLFVLSFMVLVSFGITLGAYWPALSIYESNPDLFHTVRGGVLALYDFGGVFGQLTLLVILLYEIFSKSGVVQKKWGFVIIAILLAFLALMVFKILPRQMISLTVLLIPLTLGYAYVKKSEQAK